MVPQVIYSESEEIRPSSASHGVQEPTKVHEIKELHERAESEGDRLIRLQVDKAVIEAPEEEEAKEAVAQVPTAVGKMWFKITSVVAPLV